MVSKTLLVTLMIAYVEARFGQEQVPIAAISAVQGGAAGAAATIAGATISDLLGAANACAKLSRADQIVTELGGGADAIAAAIGLVAAEKNTNPFANGNAQNVCADASLPATAALRGITPLIDPDVDAAGGVAALSQQTQGTPLDATGKSVFDLLSEAGFGDLVVGQDAAGGAAGSAAAAGGAQAGNNAAAGNANAGNANAGNNAAAGNQNAGNANAGNNNNAAAGNANQNQQGKGKNNGKAKGKANGKGKNANAGAAAGNQNAGNANQNQQQAKGKNAGAGAGAGNNNAAAGNQNAGNANQNAGNNNAAAGNQNAGNANQNAGNNAQQGNAAAGNANAGAAAGNANAGAAAGGAADFGACAQPTITFQGGEGNRPDTEFTFQIADATARGGQGEALNPNIITNALCNNLTNFCKANAAAIALCEDGKAQVQAAGTRDKSTADLFNTAIGFAGAVTNPAGGPANPPAAAAGAARKMRRGMRSA